MRALAVGVAATSPALVVLAWAAVRRGLLSVWSAMALAVGPLAVAGIASGRVAGPWDEHVFTRGVLGVAAGIGLYAATAAFMWLFRRWGLLARHASGIYAMREGLPVPAALAIAAFVVGPGEEIVWRGVVQSVLAEPFAPAVAAIVTWAVYVAVNAASGSVAIVLGAVIGGAVWGALAWWTGGVLASALCHVVWTAMMIAVPPVFSR